MSFSFPKQLQDDSSEEDASEHLFFAKKPTGPPASTPSHPSNTFPKSSTANLSTLNSSGVDAQQSPRPVALHASTAAHTAGPSKPAARLASKALDRSHSASPGIKEAPEKLASAASSGLTRPPQQQTRAGSITPSSTSHRQLNVTPASSFKPRKLSGLGHRAHSGEHPRQKSAGSPASPTNESWAQEMMKTQQTMHEHTMSLEKELQNAHTENQSLHRQLQNLSIAKAKASQMALTQIKSSSEK